MSEITKDNIAAIHEKWREQSSEVTTVILGHREVFSHHATLSIDEEDIDFGRALFKELTEDSPFDDQRHHPFIRALNIIKGVGNVAFVKLLPGETYEVLQVWDDEVVRPVAGRLPRYTITEKQIDEIMTHYSVDPTSEKADQLRQLVSGR